MRAPWYGMLRVCREVAYGIGAMSAVMRGQQPGVPPYPPPSVFTTGAMAGLTTGSVTGDGGQPVAGG
ncbi:hypothetical protein [Streptomyces sp. JJ36]|uniref:hypothetical protein n=1 Tax=Streptomyces sp. JJ36 TaxID=2736645 RepID=UPI001F2465CE|nr:hypothetical protein [Streptomyces sp. JJ36]MCF6524993.1 hypothetical protein [Streptomyces sp. JJ36]